MSSSSGTYSDADRLVKIEIEAAEALAGLAHFGGKGKGKIDSNNKSESSSGGKWGSKGKRVMIRVKTESSPDDSITSTTRDYLLPKSSDLVSHQGVSDHQLGEEINRNVKFELTNHKQSAKVPKPSPMCGTSSVCGSRSRKNLSEAEKEARRVRRILANRESARQTIRRRQALYEELTTRAADLSWENTDLKREKELALNKYHSLKSRNELLKSQLARNVKPEVEETVEPKLTPIEIPPSPCTTCSLVLCNKTQLLHPQFTPFFLPSMIQSSNPVQQTHGLQNGIAISHSVVPGKLESSNDHGVPVNINDPRPPVYILPCPWLFPVPYHSSGIPQLPSYGMNNKEDEPFVNNQCKASSSSETITVVENLRSPLQIKVEADACASTETRPTYNLNEIPFGFPPDGGGQPVGVHDKRTVFMPSPLSTVVPSSNLKYENGLQPDYVRGEVVSTSSVVESFPQEGPRIKDQESVFFLSKRAEDAAEARKRRKELTKLKSLHGRQCRLQC